MTPRLDNGRAAALASLQWVDWIRAQRGSCSSGSARTDAASTDAAAARAGDLLVRGVSSPGMHLSPRGQVRLSRSAFGARERWYGGADDARRPHRSESCTVARAATLE